MGALPRSPKENAAAGGSRPACPMPSRRPGRCRRCFEPWNSLPSTIGRSLVRHRGADVVGDDPAKAFRIELAAPGRRSISFTVLTRDDVADDGMSYRHSRRDGRRRRTCGRAGRRRPDPRPMIAGRASNPGRRADVPWLHRAVRHVLDIGAAGGAASHHAGDLGKASADSRLVVKMRPEWSRSGTSAWCVGAAGSTR